MADDLKTTDLVHRDMGPGFTHFDGPDCGCMRDHPLLPAPVGSGEVIGNDPFPSVVEKLKDIPPRRDNGSGSGPAAPDDE
jgi:hypothetical protein